MLPGFGAFLRVIGTRSESRFVSRLRSIAVDRQRENLPTSMPLLAEIYRRREHHCHFNWLSRAFTARRRNHR
jgi:hypothetical protein